MTRREMTEVYANVPAHAEIEERAAAYLDQHGIPEQDFEPDASADEENQQDEAGVEYNGEGDRAHTQSLAWFERNSNLHEDIYHIYIYQMCRRWRSGCGWPSLGPGNWFHLP